MYIAGLTFTLAAALLSTACGGGKFSSGKASAAEVPGLSLLQSMPFRSGVAHTDGRYGFTPQNFLIEGAQRLMALGSKSAFIYMTPNFRNTYPDRGAPMWPAADPQSLAQLAQTVPYQVFFNAPFQSYVLTAYSFANNDRVSAFVDDTNAAAAEEQEFYDLTRHLLTTYAGTGKVFILKHWEGDSIGTAFNWGSSIPPNMVTAMINWLQARQRGVERARKDAGAVNDVGVFTAVEVNRVFDFSEKGLTRVVNAVLPYINADLVSYSSYDSSLRGQDPPSTAAAMKQALQVIDQYAPDPLGLGKRRIFISEFGLFESERSDAVWRAKAILDTAKSAGLLSAFFWQLYDNECTANGNYFPVDSSPGQARPVANQCRGLWMIRPDGSLSPVASIIQKYF